MKNLNIESNMCFSLFKRFNRVDDKKNFFLFCVLSNFNDMTILCTFSLSNNNATSTCITWRLNASSTTNITKSDGQFDVNYRDIATG